MIYLIVTLAIFIIFCGQLSGKTKGAVAMALGLAVVGGAMIFIALQPTDVGQRKLVQDAIGMFGLLVAVLGGAAGAVLLHWYSPKKPPANDRGAT